MCADMGYLQNVLLSENGKVPNGVDSIFLFHFF